MSINTNVYIGDMGMGDGVWWSHMAWPWGFFMGFWAVIFWAVLLVIGFLVYQDAEKRGMNGVLWFILIIIPWIGIFSLLIYLIIRETKSTVKEDKRVAKDILDERYAKGELTREEYLRMKRDLDLDSE